MKDDSKDLLSRLGLVGERIKNLMKVYSLLERKEEEFCSSFSLVCTEKCGECCRHYVPSLTEGEADLAAWLLIRDEREDEILSRLSSSDVNSPVCPLFNLNKDQHCAFYAGRSMVCRLFGASVSLDKNGEPAFRDCKWKEEKRVITTAELEKKRDAIPVMSIYGEALEGEGESIYTALPKAVDKIKLLLSYSDPYSA